MAEGLHSLEVVDIVRLTDGHRRSSSPATTVSAPSAGAPSLPGDAASAAATVDEDAYDSPPKGIPFYPVFAYIKECDGNVPVTGCKGCQCRGACVMNPHCECQMRIPCNLPYSTPEGLLTNMTGVNFMELGPNSVMRVVGYGSSSSRSLLIVKSDGQENGGVGVFSRWRR